MLIKDGEKHLLVIFERFEIDYSLPKHKVKPRKTLPDSKSVSFNSDDGESADEEPRENSGFIFSTSARGQMQLSVNSGSTPNAWERLCNWCYNSVVFVSNLFAWPFKKTAPQPENVIQTFEAIFSSWEQVKLVQTRMDGCAALLKRAKSMGQKALIERIEERMKVFFFESAMLAVQLDKFISEEKLVEFALKCEKGLRLDWVKNFGRVIPHDIAEKKTKLDEAKIFDNYAVLHYDPDNKTFIETRADIAKRRDPILFGVIAGSRNLYYIGDWKDEICDLTLDDILKQVGEDGTVIPASIEEKDVIAEK